MKCLSNFEIIILFIIIILILYYVYNLTLKLNSINFTIKNIENNIKQNQNKQNKQNQYKQNFVNTFLQNKPKTNSFSIGSHLSSQNNSIIAREI